MREDITHCIEFIKEIENHPCLYDNQHVDYGNARRVQMAWKQVAEKCNDNDLNCRRKWKMIRSSYIRSFRYKAKNGTGRTEYYLSPYLQFLKPFAKPKPRDPALEVSDDGSSVKADEDQDTLDDFVDSDTADGEHSDRSKEAPSAKRVCTETTFVSVKNEDRDVKANDLVAEKDPCHLYLLSLAPHVSSMTLRQQLRFQRGVIDLIEKIKYGD